MQMTNKNAIPDSMEESELISYKREEEKRERIDMTLRILRG